MNTNADIHITPLLCLQDNFSYVLQKGTKALVVDVPEAAPLKAFLEKKNLTLTGILITHGHWDHIHGLAEILTGKNLPVYAKPHPQYPIQHISHPVHDEAPLTWEGIDIFPLHTPGHMPAHLCYHLPKINTLFSGDILFSLGCGRVIDGTFEELFKSLQRLAKLPDQTLIYFGHEYTLSNGDFAQQVFPPHLKAHKEVQCFLQKTRKNLEKGIFSTPATMAQEKKLNPFLLNVEILTALKDGAETPLAIFKRLRQRKDAL